MHTATNRPFSVFLVALTLIGLTTTPATAKDASIAVMDDTLAMFGVSAQLSPDTFGVGSSATGTDQPMQISANMIGLRFSPIDYFSVSLLGGYSNRTIDKDTTERSRVSTATIDSTAKLFDLELRGHAPIKNFRLGGGVRFGYLGVGYEISDNRNNIEKTTIDYSTTAIKVLLDAEYLIDDQFAVGLTLFAYSTVSGDGDVVTTDAQTTTPKLIDISASGPSIPGWLTFTAYLSPRKTK